MCLVINIISGRFRAFGYAVAGGGNLESTIFGLLVVYKLLDDVKMIQSLGSDCLHVSGMVNTVDDDVGVVHLLCELLDV